ncbi:MAG: NACHT domain-containing protein [Gammaproteobacteria bacterium]|nr:NACHT domain-containing protein [Gammaproteobacteria bacterium]
MVETNILMPKNYFQEAMIRSSREARKLSREAMKRSSHIAFESEQNDCLEILLNERVSCNTKKSRPDVAVQIAMEQLELQTLGYSPFNSRPDDVIQGKMERLELHTLCRNAFQKDNCSTFLLLGNSGSGKTLFTQCFAAELLDKLKAQQYQPDDDTLVPLWIPLAGLRKGKRNLDLIGYALKLLGYKSEERNKLLAKNIRWLLVLDGYDELPAELYRHLIRNSNKLENVQLLITCRHEALPLMFKEDANYRVFFIRSLERLQEYHISAFTPDQIDDFIDRYIASLGERAVWRNEDYHRELNKLLELSLEGTVHTFLTNPFLLQTILDALPEIVAGQANKPDYVEKILSTRHALYDKAMQAWFKRRAYKLVYEQGTIDDAWLKTFSILDAAEREIAVAAILRDFTAEIASDLFNHHTTILAPPGSNVAVENDDNKWSARFFDNKLIPFADVLLLNTPLRHIKNQEWEFLHKSLLEFFAADHLFNEALQRAWAIGNTNLNQRIWQTQPAVFDHLIDVTRTNERFRDQLFEVIQLSSVEPSTWRAAANAITLLAKAGISLSGYNFRHVRLGGDEEPPTENWGADLSRAILHGSDFTRADLRYVNFTHAWLNNCRFTQACLQYAEFGEYPPLPGANSVGLSLDEQHIVLAKYESSVGLNLVVSTYSTQTWQPLWQENISIFSIPSKIIKLKNSQNDDFENIGSEYSGVKIPLSFSPDNDHFATADISPPRVRLWQIKSGKYARLPLAHESEINALQYVSAVRLISIDKSSLRIWNTNTRQCLQQIDNTSFWHLSCLPNNNQFLVVADTNIIQLCTFDVHQTFHIEKLDGMITCSSTYDASVANERYWVVGTARGKLYWGDFNEKIAYKSAVYISNQAITHLLCLPKQQFLISDSEHIILWSEPSSERLLKLDCPGNYQLTHLTYSVQQEKLLSIFLRKGQAVRTDQHCLLQIHTLPEGQLTGQFTQIERAPLAFEFPLPTLIYISHLDTIIRPCFLQTHFLALSGAFPPLAQDKSSSKNTVQAVGIFNVDKRPNSMVQASTGDFLLYKGDYAWHARALKEGRLTAVAIETPYIDPFDESAWMESLDLLYHPAGQGFVVAIGSNTKKKPAIYDINAQLKKTLPVPAGLSSYQYSPQGDKLLTGHADGSIYFWGIVSGICLEALKQVHQAPITALLLNQDETILISASRKKILIADLKIPDFSADEPASHHAPKWETTNTLPITLDATYISFLEKLFNAIKNSGEADISVLEETTFLPEQAKCIGLHLNAEQTYLIADFMIGKLQKHYWMGWQLDKPAEPILHAGYLWGYGVFCAQNNFYAQAGGMPHLPAAGSLGNSFLWLLDSIPLLKLMTPFLYHLILANEEDIILYQDGQKIATLTGHKGGIPGMAFSPDGLLLASVGFDQTLRVWEIEQNKQLLCIPHSDALARVNWHSNVVENCDKAGILFSRDYCVNVMAGEGDMFCWQLTYSLKEKSIREKLRWTTNEQSLVSHHVDITRATGLKSHQQMLLQTRGSTIGKVTTANDQKLAYILAARDKQRFFKTGKREIEFNNSKIIIDSETWVVSVVRLRRPFGGKHNLQHTYLILQGIVNNHTVIQECHYQFIIDTATFFRKYGNGKVHLIDISPWELEQKREHLIWHDFEISREDGEKLTEQVRSEMNSNLSYWVGGRGVGENCLSWCVRHLETIGIREENLASLRRLQRLVNCVAVVPSHLLPDREPESSQAKW